MIKLLMLLLTVSAQARELDCSKPFKTEQRAVNSIATTEFLGVANSSGAYVANARWKCFRNNDTTAANLVYISSFSMTAATIDTMKGFAIPGGSTEDAVVCFPWGANIRTFLFRLSGLGTVNASACE